MASPMPDISDAQYQWASLGVTIDELREEIAANRLYVPARIAELVEDVHRNLKRTWDMVADEGQGSG